MNIMNFNFVSFWSLQYLFTYSEANKIEQRTFKNLSNFNNDSFSWNSFLSSSSPLCWRLSIFIWNSYKNGNIKLLYLLKPNNPQKLVPVDQKVGVLFLLVAGCHFGAPNETQIWHLHTRLKKLSCNSHFFDNCKYQKPGRQKSWRN